MDKLHKLISHLSQEERNEIDRAYRFARDAHEGVTRKSGLPYIVHPVEVAIIVAELGASAEVIVAALLHDTVEDVEHITLELIEKTFGRSVMEIVEGETKISKLRKKDNLSVDDDAANTDLRLTFMSMFLDYRVTMVKLADRLHNMRTLDHMPPHKQIRIAQETLDYFAPIAHQAGIQEIYNELQDLAFAYVNPDESKRINAYLQPKIINLGDFFRQARQQIEQAVENDPNRPKSLESFSIFERIKSTWSVHRKTLGGKNLEDILDIFAMRIILKLKKMTAADFPNLSPEAAEEMAILQNKNAQATCCYYIMGIVNTLWKPRLGSFKDYISLPKENGYQSLHTTVIYNDEWVEFQIRTEEMNQVAEKGYAAHWQYKGEQVNTISKEALSNTDFLELFRNELANRRIRVLTPKGKSLHLQQGATALDFAYHVHSDIGNTAARAIVNGRLQPLSAVLRNGDVVRIETDKHVQPSPKWLTLVASPTAKNKIRTALKNKERNEEISTGRMMLESHLKKHGLPFRKLLTTKRLEMAAYELLGQANHDEIFLALAQKRLSLRKVARVLTPEATEAETPPKSAPRAVGKSSPENNGVEVYIDGTLTEAKLNQCCRPQHGDHIVGYLTRGRGLSVHRVDCNNIGHLIAKEPERFVSATWEQNPAQHEQNFCLSVIDRPNMLSDILQGMSAIGCQVMRINAELISLPDKHAQIWLRLASEEDTNNLDKAIPALLTISGIERARKCVFFGPKNKKNLRPAKGTAT